MLSYRDLLDIGLSPDEATLQAHLEAIAGRLGFGLYGGTLIRGRLSSGKANVHGFGNPPAAYLASFRSQDIGKRDALLTAMLAKEGCHVYDQAFYENAGAGDIWDNQAAFGYRSGMAISLHEHSHQEMFSFGVDSPDALPSSPTARAELGAALRLVALHAQEAALRLFTPAATLDPGQVAPPELEALRWAVDAQVVWKKGDVTVVSNPGMTKRSTSAAAAPRVVLRAIKGGLIDY